MDLLEGETLRDYTNRLRGVPLADLVTIGIQICRALESLHSIGVIHRDLNLANIIRGEDGHITIFDLGIAKRLPGFRGVVGSLTHPDLRVVTSAGQCGTPGYIAPEVGALVTEKVDVFGLGAVLYALYTGREYDGDHESLASSLMIGFACRSPHVAYESDILLELLEELLVADPNCRPPLDDATVHLESISELLADELTERKLKARAKKFVGLIDVEEDSANWAWLRWVDLGVLAFIGVCFGVALFDLGAETEKSAAAHVVVVGPRSQPPTEQAATVPTQATAADATVAVPADVTGQATTGPVLDVTDQATAEEPRPKRSRKKSTAQREFEATLPRVLRLCGVTPQTVRYRVGRGRVRLSYADPVGEDLERCVLNALPHAGRFTGKMNGSKR